MRTPASIHVALLATLAAMLHPRHVGVDVVGIVAMLAAGLLELLTALGAFLVLFVVVESLDRARRLRVVR